MVCLAMPFPPAMLARSVAGAGERHGIVSIVTGTVGELDLSVVFGGWTILLGRGPRRAR